MFKNSREAGTLADDDLVDFVPEVQPVALVPEVHPVAGLIVGLGVVQDDFDCVEEALV